MIYATPFKASTRLCIGPSANSGFTSLEQVIATMGPPTIRPGPVLLIYGDTDDRVLFSKIPFRIDDKNNNG